MKKIALSLALLLGLGSCVGPAPELTPTPTAPHEIIRVDKPGCLPVSTKSIKAVLDSTGRFYYQKIMLPDGVINVDFSLDRTDENEGWARLFYEVLPGDTTTILSYNFSKADVNGEAQDAIRWGLDTVLRILGVELTDDAWADIMTIAAKPEKQDAWGTDYAGLVDETAGVRLIYGNLGEKVQVDVRGIER